MRSQVIQVLFRQMSLQEGLVLVPARSLWQLWCLLLGSGLAEGGIVASEERRAPRVAADLLKVIYCPSSSVLQSPFQVLNTTQLKNSIFSQDSMEVSAKGLEGYTFNPNLEFVHWSLAGSYHDMLTLFPGYKHRNTACIQAFVGNYFPWTWKLEGPFCLVYYFMTSTGFCNQAWGGKGDCFLLYVVLYSICLENKQQTRWPPLYLLA